MGSRVGCSWSAEDDRVLTNLFHSYASFEEMAQALDRTWFACKCRVIRLGLLDEEIKPKYKQEEGEKYRVPNISDIISSLNTVRPDTNISTYNDTEIDLIISYLKTRIANLEIEKLDSICFKNKMDVNLVQNILKDEISKLKVYKNLDMNERSKKLRRFA